MVSGCRCSSGCRLPPVGRRWGCCSSCRHLFGVSVGGVRPDWFGGWCCSSLRGWCRWVSVGCSWCADHVGRVSGLRVALRGRVAHRVGVSVSWPGCCSSSRPGGSVCPLWGCRGGCARFGILRPPGGSLTRIGPHQCGGWSRTSLRGTALWLGKTVNMRVITLSESYDGKPKWWPEAAKTAILRRGLNY